MRVACDAGRRIEDRWLALGGGVGDGEAAGVGGSGGAPAHALGKFPPPWVVWCSFGVALGGEVLASRL